MAINELFPDAQERFSTALTDGQAVIPSQTPEYRPVSPAISPTTSVIQAPLPSAIPVTPAVRQAPRDEISLEELSALNVQQKQTPASNLQDIENVIREPDNRDFFDKLGGAIGGATRNVYTGLIESAIPIYKSLTRENVIRYSIDKKNKVTTRPATMEEYDPVRAQDIADLQDSLLTHTEPIRKKANELLVTNKYDKNIVQYFKDGEYNKAGSLLGWSVVEQVPNMLAVLGTTMAGHPEAALTVLGLAATGNKYTEIKDADIPENVKVNNALITGMLEVVTEGLGEVMPLKYILKTDNALKTFKKGFASTVKTTAKNISLMGATEGFEEMGNELGSTILDITSGLRPEDEKLTPYQRFTKYSDAILSSGILGAAGGMAMGAGASSVSAIPQMLEGKEPTVKKATEGKIGNVLSDFEAKSNLKDVSAEDIGKLKNNWDIFFDGAQNVTNPVLRKRIDRVNEKITEQYNKFYPIQQEGEVIQPVEEPAKPAPEPVGKPIVEQPITPPVIPAVQEQTIEAQPIPQQAIPIEPITQEIVNAEETRKAVDERGTEEGIERGTETGLRIRDNAQDGLETEEVKTVPVVQEEQMPAPVQEQKTEEPIETLQNTERRVKRNKIDKVLQKFKNKKFKLDVYNNFDEIPEDIRREIMRSAKGTPEQIAKNVGGYKFEEGFAIVLDNNSTDEINYNVIHELVGHYGIDKVLENTGGNTLAVKSMLHDIWESKQNDIRALLNTKGWKFNLDTVSGQRSAVYEYMADIAGKKLSEQPDWFTNFKAKLKSYFKKVLGIDLADEKINELIRDSLKYLEYDTKAETPSKPMQKPPKKLPKKPIVKEQIVRKEPVVKAKEEVAKAIPPTQTQSVSQLQEAKKTIAQAKKDASAKSAPRLGTLVSGAKNYEIYSRVKDGEKTITVLNTENKQTKEFYDTAKAKDYVSKQAGEEPTMKLSVKDVYHGTTQDFESFSLENMGGGEGAQAFGYGLYFTSREDIAKWYAKLRGYYGESPMKLVRTYFKKGNMLPAQSNSTEWAWKEISETEAKGENELLVKRLISPQGKEVFYKKIKRPSPIKLYNKVIDYKEDANKNWSAQVIQVDETGKRNPPDSNPVTIKQLPSAGELKKFGIRPLGNVFRVNLWENKQETLLTWNTKVPSNILANVLANTQDADIKNGIEAKPNITGEELYKLISSNSSWEKAAEYLKNSGIDGIKYPAQSKGKGDGSRGWNYVVFDPKEISIQPSSIKLSIKGEPTVEAITTKEGKYVLSKYIDTWKKNGLEVAKDIYHKVVRDKDAIEKAERQIRDTKSLEEAIALYDNTPSSDEQMVIGAVVHKNIQKMYKENLDEYNKALTAKDIVTSEEFNQARKNYHVAYDILQGWQEKFGAKESIAGRTLRSAGLIKFESYFDNEDNFMFNAMRLERKAKRVTVNKNTVAIQNIMDLIKEFKKDANADMLQDFNNMVNLILTSQLNADNKEVNPTQVRYNIQKYFDTIRKGINEGKSFDDIMNGLKPEIVKQYGEKAFDKIRSRLKEKHTAFIKKAKEELLKDIARRLGVETKDIDKKTREAIPVKIDKLLQAGDITREDIENAFVNTKDIQERYTPEIQKKVQELVKQYKDAPEDSPDKYQAQIDLVALLKELVQGTQNAEIGVAFWYASILSGLNTHARNVLFTAANSLGNMLTLGLQNPKAFATSMSLALKYMPAVLESSKRALQGKEVIQDVDLFQDTSGGALKFPSTTTLKKLTFAKSLRDKVGEKNAKYADRALGFADLIFYALRALKMEDATFWQFLQQFHQGYMLTEEAQKSGISRADIKEYVMEGLNLTEEKTDQYRKEAITEFKKQNDGKEPNMEVKADKQYIEKRIIEKQEAKRNRLYREMAYDWASRGTLNYKPEGFAGLIAESIEKALAGYADKGAYGKLALRLGVFPFTRIVANVVNAMIEVTPLAYGGMAIKKITGRTLADGFNVPTERIEQELKSRQIKAAVGTLALVGLGALILSQLSKPEEERWIDITAYGPLERDKRATWLLNHQPYTIKLFGKTFSYTTMPAGLGLTMLGIGADMYKYYGESLKDKNMVEKIISATWYLTAGTSRAVLEASFLNNITTLMDVVSKPDIAQESFEVPRNLQRYVASMTTSIIPRAFKDIDGLFSSDMKETNTLGGMIIKNIPVVSHSLKPKLNILGDPIPASNIPGLHAYLRNVPEDKVYTLLSNANIGLNRASTAYSTINYLKLNEDEKYKINQLAGKYLKDYLVQNYDSLSKIEDKGILQSIIGEVSREYNKIAAYQLGKGSYPKTAPEEYKKIIKEIELKRREAGGGSR